MKKNRNSQSPQSDEEDEEVNVTENTKSEKGVKLEDIFQMISNSPDITKKGTTYHKLKNYDFERIKKTIIIGNTSEFVPPSKKEAHGLHKIKNPFFFFVNLANFRSSFLMF